MVTVGGMLSPPEAVGIGVGFGVTVETVEVFFTERIRVCEPAFPEVSRAVILIVRDVATVFGIIQV